MGSGQSVSGGKEYVSFASPMFVVVDAWPQATLYQRANDEEEPALYPPQQWDNGRRNSVESVLIFRALLD